MLTKSRCVTVILMVLMLCLASCADTAELCPLEVYSNRYNATAKKFGFAETTIKPSDSGVCGFAAFDGLFIVCLCTTSDSDIYAVDISTGTQYASKIKDSKEEFEKAALSAAYLVAPLYIEEATDDDISSLAGMILAAIEGETIEIQKNIELSGSNTTSGGFELTVSLIGK